MTWRGWSVLACLALLALVAGPGLAAWGWWAGEGPAMRLGGVLALSGLGLAVLAAQDD